MYFFLARLSCNLKNLTESYNYETESIELNKI